MLLISMTRQLAKSFIFITNYDFYFEVCAKRLKIASDSESIEQRAESTTFVRTRIIVNKYKGLRALLN